MNCYKSAVVYELMEATTRRVGCELGDCCFEVLLECSAGSEGFLGIGEVFIGGTSVRSGRLPLRPETQTFPDGYVIDRLLLRDIEKRTGELRILLDVSFKPSFAALMRDHSFDPIHNTSDWNVPAHKRRESLEVVIRTAADEFNGVSFNGFSYHYDYTGVDTPLFNLLDKASWELGGNIEGVTAVSQSSCSSPVVTFQPETIWSTEGIIFFDERAQRENSVMTHNLPRWASHGAFDFQFKGDATLIGIFERVELIRSLLKREPGKPELKCFDKHLFDQSLHFSTSPKHILLNTEAKTSVDQKNLWTWIQDEVYERARAEFGLKEEPITPRVTQNFWLGFTVEDYQNDLLPAAASIGARQIFVDNLNQSDLTCEHPTASNGNMCCGHEYRLAPSIGGIDGVASFVAKCHEFGVEPFAWTNNGQSLSSPLQRVSEKHGWFVKMEDSRLKYGGAYSSLLSIWNFKNNQARRYWIDSLKSIKDQTGLSGYLFDSFYNLGFMPIDYSEMKPTTQWRELLSALKELQEAGIHFLIESFGPFGQVQHGCPASYNIENLFACYKIGLGSGYTTIPGGDVIDVRVKESNLLYSILAHMTDPHIPLFVEGERIDRLWLQQHRQALAHFHDNRDLMFRRYLQEDGQGVLWHDREGRLATLWNFVTREAILPGKVTDVTTGEVLVQSEYYGLLACHTYRIEASSSQILPRTVSQAQVAELVPPAS